MKRKNIFCIAAIALVAVMMASCEKGPYQNTGSKAETYIQINIAFAEPETKADSDDSGNYLEAAESEYQVNNAYLYLFKQSNNTYYKTIKIAGDNSTDNQFTTNQNGTNNWYYTSKPQEIDPGAYNIYATINHEVTDLTTNTTTEDQFQEMVIVQTEGFNMGVPSSGMPMSSRGKDGTLYAANVSISSANTFDNPVQVSLDIERSWAKVRCQIESSNSFSVKADRATTGTDIANISLIGYKLVNCPSKYHLFRQVANLKMNTNTPELEGHIAFTALTNKTATGSDSSTEGTNYLYTPLTTSFITGTYPTPITNFKGDHDFIGIGSEDGQVNISTSEMTHIGYLLENSMHETAQKLGYATAVIFKAKITPADGNFFTIVNTDIETATYNGSDPLYYFNNKFYENLDALNKHTNLGVTEDNYAEFGVKYYYDGTCFYRYYIEHWDNGIDPTDGTADMGVMEYAIVRNNSYDITVSSILAPGISNTNNNDTGYPVGDDELLKDIEIDEVYFQVQLTIRPWVVRTQSAVLG